MSEFKKLREKDACLMFQSEAELGVGTRHGISKYWNQNRNYSYMVSQS